MNLSILNENQHRVVTLSINPKEVSDILIVAGAGSGKTRVLTYRIAYILEQNVFGGEILALTFTKKAANEMRERLQSMSVNGSQNVKLSTFHSLANDMLKALLPGEPFAIIDDSDQRQLLRDLIKDNGFTDRIQLKDYMSWLSFQRNKMNDPTKSLPGDQQNVVLFRELTKIYYAAKKKLGGAGGVKDFDDLLEAFYEILNTRPQVREALHRRWHYILVDEYQDTNQLQFKILQLIRGKDAQLLQVGDEDQLIYSWRGAEIAHIMDSYRIAKAEGKVVCVTLDKNYRCSANILELANELIAENVERTGKVLTPNKSSGEPVLLGMYNSCSEEAAELSNLFRTWHSSGVKYKEMAVLVRMNRMTRSLEAAFIRDKIPYQLHNGVALFDAKECRLLMALMNFTECPHEGFFLRQVMNVIKMGIGDAAFAKLSAEQQKSGVDWIELLENNKKYSANFRVKEFIANFKTAKEKLKFGDLCGAAKTWILDWELLQFFKEDERESRSESLTLFIEVLEDYQLYADVQKTAATMSGFHENRLLDDTVTDKDKGDVVHIMTLHKAKGLEFKCGAIMGMQDGIFPLTPEVIGSSSSREERGEIEETQRLAYVGVTRFEQNLVITRANYRKGFNRLSGDSSILDPHLTKLMSRGVVRYAK